MLRSRGRGGVQQALLLGVCVVVRRVARRAQRYAESIGTPRPRCAPVGWGQTFATGPRTQAVRRRRRRGARRGVARRGRSSARSGADGAARPERSAARRGAAGAQRVGAHVIVCLLLGRLSVIVVVFDVHSVYECARTCHICV